MAANVIGVNDPKAVKKWGVDLSYETFTKSYFAKKFIGKNLPIQKRDELIKSSGDKISYDLTAQLTGAGTEGDGTVKHEGLAFYTDEVYVDQKRHGVDTGGKMSKQRILHDLRAVAKTLLSDWHSRYMDEQIQYYLSGARGITKGLEPITFTGRANNPLVAPTASHLVYGGSATSKATLAATDIITIGLIEKLTAKAETMNEESEASQIQPIMIGGEEHYVLQMHSYQAYDMRTNATAGEWMDIQKAAAGSTGDKSKIFKGSLGMINNVVLQKHPRNVRFDDYGAGSNVEAARALFLGQQAGVCAFGGASKGGDRVNWFEEMVNSGNDLQITVDMIYGVTKAQFNDMDYGVFAVDTAAAKPTGI